MSVVKIKINGRDYQLACDDGQEEHLQSLAEEIDERVSSLVFGMKSAPGEGMSLLLAAVTMADELSENKKEIEKLSAEVKRMQGLVAKPKDSDESERLIEMERAMATTLSEIAARIEKITDNIEVG